MSLKEHYRRAYRAARIAAHDPAWQWDHMQAFHAMRYIQQNTPASILWRADNHLYHRSLS